MYCFVKKAFQKSKMITKELNLKLNKLRIELEANNHDVALKLLTIIEMLVDRGEENNLLVKDRLDECLSGL